MAKAPVLNPYYDLHRDISRLPQERLETMRKKVVWAYSWAVPDPMALQLIAAQGPIMELGAGTGYWSWLLRQQGIDVLAFDREPAQPPTWTEVIQADESIVKKHPGRALMLCWPPLDDGMAARALKAYTGNTLIYVGEWHGRTADREFHALIDREWNWHKVHSIPTWPGFDDRLWIFRRSPIH